MNEHTGTTPLPFERAAHTLAFEGFLHDGVNEHHHVADQVVVEIARKFAMDAGLEAVQRGVVGYFDPGPLGMGWRIHASCG